MFTLYSMQRSGNSYKTRLALCEAWHSVPAGQIDILKGGKSHTPRTS